MEAGWFQPWSLDWQTGSLRGIERGVEAFQGIWVDFLEMRWKEVSDTVEG